METLLESGADVNAVDHSGLSALHLATDGEQTRAIKLLVKNGANLENRDLGLGWTPLIRCVTLVRKMSFDYLNNAEILTPIRDHRFHNRMLKRIRSNGQTLKYPDFMSTLQLDPIITAKSDETVGTLRLL
ncbi:hypothetical protein AHF37_06657 [Paragonimus kellicotti]|nr:hypothetical protein AHF37_06657 [Paragonimus kellicotti]